MNDRVDIAGEREDALREWREQTALRDGLDRRFSGERIKRAFSGDRLTKAAFVAGTGAVLFVVFNHDSKEQRLLNKEARAAMQVEEPSVRDFRPPVMPTRLAAEVTPAPPAAPPKKDDHPQATQVDADALAKRRRSEQLAEARLKSEIIVKAGGPAAAAAPAVPAAPSVQPRPEARLSGGLAAEPTDPNSVFTRQVSGRTVQTSVPHRRNNLHCVAMQGKLIDAELETAINTDLPGQIRAIVSAPLYAEQGRDPILTPGSRLIGAYNSAVQKGQVRVFAVWNRAIRPDGVEVVLDSSITDALGRSGVAGETDNHFLQVFGTSILLSIFGAGTSVVGVSSDARNNSVDEYRREIQQSFGRTADKVLEPYARIQPTNTVRQGERIKVFLNRDLDFCSLLVAAAERRELILP